MKKHTSLKSKFNSAFSLVELLVVIAVIAVIAAIAIPNISNITGSAQDARAEVSAGALDRVVEAARAAKVGTHTNYSFGATNAAVAVAGTNATYAGLARTELLAGRTLTATYTNRAYNPDGTETNEVSTQEFTLQNATTAQ